MACGARVVGIDYVVMVLVDIADVARSDLAKLRNGVALFEMAVRVKVFWLVIAVCHQYDGASHGIAFAVEVVVSL